MEMVQENQLIDPKQLLLAFQQGATQLIQQKQRLNQINVFPVSDGDTGSILASLMQAILEETAGESQTVLEVFEKVAMRLCWVLAEIRGLFSPNILMVFTIIYCS